MKNENESRKIINSHEKERILENKNKKKKFKVDKKLMDPTVINQHFAIEIGKSSHIKM